MSVTGGRYIRGSLRYFTQRLSSLYDDRQRIVIWVFRVLHIGEYKVNSVSYIF